MFGAILGLLGIGQVEPEPNRHQLDLDNLRRAFETSPAVRQAAQFARQQRQQVLVQRHREQERISVFTSGDLIVIADDLKVAKQYNIITTPVYKVMERFPMVLRAREHSYTIVHIGTYNIQEQTISRHTLSAGHRHSPIQLQDTSWTTVKEKPRYNRALPGWF